MKNIIIPAIAITVAFTACNSNNEKKQDTKPKQENTPAEQVYACPMHPEVTGKKGDKCPKCGMELSVPVSKPSSSTHSDTRASIV